MQKDDYYRWAYQLASEENFDIKKDIRFATYYDGQHVRSAVFEVVYQDKPAILKLYDDPRPTFEVQAHQQFLENNRSQTVLAPKLYKSCCISTHKGWLLMERVPDAFKCFSRPVTNYQRSELLEVYFEYLNNNPTRPNRPPMLTEHLSASEFHCFRLSRWLALAVEEESKLVEQDITPILDPLFFPALYIATLDNIRHNFANIEMKWFTHGLFQVTDVFHEPLAGRYYLTDFCRSGMYPEGYGLASLIWSDWLIGADWRLKESDFILGLEDWYHRILKAYYAKTCQIWSQYASRLKACKIEYLLESLLDACLIERIMGTILADVTANAKMQIEEKRARVDLLTKILQKRLIKR